MFKKKPHKTRYDKTNKKAVLKCSICTGEQVAGFKDIHTGHFDEIMLIRDAADLDAFMEMYDVAAISKEYQESLRKGKFEFGDEVYAKNY